MPTLSPNTRFNSASCSNADTGGDVARGGGDVLRGDSNERDCGGSTDDARRARRLCELRSASDRLRDSRGAASLALLDADKPGRRGTGLLGSAGVGASSKSFVVLIFTE